ncbi:hypothetical protein, partial [Dulcicalothrix desertica]|uniref:hypothetical protein n=1 Tax=Dulcicalothrix desertica TaxID=32056 RepID=UPI001F45B213
FLKFSYDNDYSRRVAAGDSFATFTPGSISLFTVTNLALVYGLAPLNYRTTPISVSLCLNTKRIKFILIIDICRYYKGLQEGNK